MLMEHGVCLEMGGSVWLPESLLSFLEAAPPPRLTPKLEAAKRSEADTLVEAVVCA